VHSFDSWLGAKFDHSTTGFLLTNAIANGPCASCHIKQQLQLDQRSDDCGNSRLHLTTCSRPTIRALVGGPGFGVLLLGMPHTISWTTAIFESQYDGFLLTTVRQRACASCHINNNYTWTIAPTECGNSGMPF